MAYKARHFNSTPRPIATPEQAVASQDEALILDEAEFSPLLISILPPVEDFHASSTTTLIKGISRC
jgi:hypothetical protein